MGEGLRGYWRHGVGRWLWWAIVTAPFWLVSTFVLIRDGVLSPKHRNAYILQFLPPFRSHWYWYVIVALVYVLLVTAVVARKANRATIRNIKERHRESFRRSREHIWNEHSENTSREDWLRELLKEHDLVRLQPNIVHPVQGEVADVHWGENGVIVKGISDAAENFRSLIAPYQNSPDTRPSRRITAVRGVMSEVTFTDFAKEKLVQKIHHGAWLSEKGHNVDFGITQKHDLIIAAIRNNTEVSAVRREFNSVHPDGVTTLEPIASDLSLVRIRLITESSGTVLDDYQMILEITREPEFKIELHWALLWRMYFLSTLESHGYDFLKAVADIRHDALEKRMALPLNKFVDPQANADIRAEEKNAEAPIAKLASDWEAATADFVGHHISETAKKEFLERSPSIEAGFQRVKKSPFSRILLKKDDHWEPNWTLYDSIEVRVNYLDTIRKDLR